MTTYSLLALQLTIPLPQVLRMSPAPGLEDATPWLLDPSVPTEPASWVRDLCGPTGATLRRALCLSQCPCCHLQMHLHFT